MRVLVAPDKFKGSLTAHEAADCIVAGWRESWPECEIVELPIADGGDGTLEAVKATLGGERLKTTARDARGRPRQAPWLWQQQRRTAWIETAGVCGLAGLCADELDPLNATTAGLGDMIRSALQAGAKRIFLCLGGSATNDGGCGMATALGYVFRGRHGAAFDPVPCNLSALDRIERPTRIASCNFTALTDVRNPLLGPRGASCTYAPQKGASSENVEQLEALLARLAGVAVRDLGAPDPQTPGAGAAGGLGFGVMAFLGGGLLPGFETIAGMMGLADAVASADIVITGEGRLDDQTGEGKAPAGVARIARSSRKPVIAFAGSIPLSISARSGFDATVQIAENSMTLQHAMTNAGTLLRGAAARTARLVREGGLL